MNVIDKYFLEKKVMKIDDLCLNLYQSENLDKYFNSLKEKDLDSLIDAPYFVNVWKSGVFLSQYFILANKEKQLKGKTILELGSGCGLLGIVLSLLGADVIFTDYLEESLLLCRENAKLNGLDNISTLKADWNNFPHINRKIDLVVGSDLLYEQDLAHPLFVTIDGFLKAGIPVIFSDPQRIGLSSFLSFVKEGNYNTKLLSESDENLPVKVFMIQ